MFIFMKLNIKQSNWVDMPHCSVLFSYNETFKS